MQKQKTKTQVAKPVVKKDDQISKITGVINDLVANQIIDVASVDTLAQGIADFTKICDNVKFGDNFVSGASDLSQSHKRTKQLVRFGCIFSKVKQPKQINVDQLSNQDKLDLIQRLQK